MRADLMTPSSNVAAQRFYELIWPHTQDVLRTARLLSHDATEAEDLSQDTFLKAFRRIDALHDRERVRPWLMSILRNTHIDRVRAKRRHTVSLDELEFDPAGREGAVAKGPDYRETADELPPGAQNHPSHDADSVMEELADRKVIQSMRELPRDIRRTILLVDVEGMQESEAAEALGIPLGTVKSRLHRGRGILRQKLYPHARDLHLAN